MPTLVLSAHLDDAVLSLGATLADAQLRGEAVRVVTLFSESSVPFRSAPLGFRPRALAPERAAEEARAMEILGVGHVNLGLLDAPFRDRRYRAYHRLLGPVPAWDQVGELALARVREEIREFKPRRIWAPLAVGGHVDHRITHAVARMLEEECPVTYYEDLPYALAPHALERRLRELGHSTDRTTLEGTKGGTKRGTDRARGGPGHASLARTRAAWTAALRVARHVSRHPVTLARPAWQRGLTCLGAWAWTLREEVRVQPGIARALWRPEVREASAEAFDRKLRAIACYQSQLPTLFASLDQGAELLRGYADCVQSTPTSYVERLWNRASQD